MGGLRDRCFGDNIVGATKVARVCASSASSAVVGGHPSIAPAKRRPEVCPRMLLSMANRPAIRSSASSAMGGPRRGECRRTSCAGLLLCRTDVSVASGSRRILPHSTRSAREVMQPSPKETHRHCHVNIGLAAWNQSDDVAPIMRRAGRSSPAAKYLKPRSGPCGRRWRPVGADADESGHR